MTALQVQYRGMGSPTVPNSDAVVVRLVGSFTWRMYASRCLVAAVIMCKLVARP